MPPSRRNELVDAAMRVFARHGFHGTGIEQVLQAAGVSRMTLYNHFASKDELIVAALERRDECFREELEAFVEARARTPVERLLAVFDFHREWFRSDGFSGCMFINAGAEFGEPGDPVHQAASESKRRLVEYLRDQCAAAGASDPAHLARQLVILLEGATVMAQLHPPSAAAKTDRGESAELAREAAEMLIERAGVHARA